MTDSQIKTNLPGTNPEARAKREEQKKLSDASKAHIDRSIKVSLSGAPDNVEYGKIWVITKDGMVSDFTVSKAIGHGGKSHGMYVINETSDIKSLLVRKTNPDQKALDDLRKEAEIKMLEELKVLKDGKILEGPLAGVDFRLWDIPAKGKKETNDKLELATHRKLHEGKKQPPKFKSTKDLEEFFSKEEKTFHNKLASVEDDAFWKKVDEQAPDTWVTKVGTGSNSREQAVLAVPGVKNTHPLTYVMDQLGSVIYNSLTRVGNPSAVPPAPSNTAEVDALKKRIASLEEALKKANSPKAPEAVTGWSKHDQDRVREGVNTLMEWRQTALQTLDAERHSKMEILKAYTALTVETGKTPKVFEEVDGDPNESQDSVADIGWPNLDA